MHIAIVGVGGVGGYIGAKLLQSGIKNVTFIAPQHHVTCIQKEGLTLLEDKTSFTVTPSIATQPTNNEHYDIIFLCVKSYDIAAAIQNISTALTKESLIIPLSNGVEHREVIQKLTSAKVVDAAIYILVHLQEVGVVKKEGKVFNLILPSELKESPLLPLLEAAGLRYKLFDNIKEAIWKKYFFISAFAMLTSFYDAIMNEVYHQHGSEARLLLEEIALVARTLGLNLDAEVEKSLNIVASLPVKASTSMHLDITKKRRSEIETLCNYLVKISKEKKLKTPLMNSMYDSLLKKISE